MSTTLDNVTKTEMSADYNLQHDDVTLATYTEQLYNVSKSSAKKYNERIDDLLKIRGTLLERYGPKGRHVPGIVDEDFSTIQMVFAVIEHYRGS